ncbi:hypothetical protein KL86DYS1_12195 [uncultured Dysgonomonas sp.]|uniref:Uncharacterized protein n=1 Tax=uncultured Dysgonomonas sp. TaxID=206096 RepID=A0A212JGI3_9BACT|nr:hypothetical protein KL86DYS1_12195 [uncultured Dysgonomonas sp.]
MNDVLRLNIAQTSFSFIKKLRSNFIYTRRKTSLRDYSDMSFYGLNFVHKTSFF